MIPLQCGMFWILILIFMCAQYGDAASNPRCAKSVEMPEQSVEKTNVQLNKAFEEDDIVKIQDFYESLCIYCRQFMVNDLSKAINKLRDRVDVHCYPYGNAKTIEHEDGTYDFDCQHGPKECYGNMLHACALDLVKNHTAAINFNTCLVDLNEKAGSDDKMADKCGKQMNIDSEAIKTCAKGPRGKELHKYYGEESKKIQYYGVPHVRINDVHYDGTDFLKAVCDAFKNPPKECNK